jgi:hypothetical protein
MYKLVAILIVFLLGLYFITQPNSMIMESFEDPSSFKNPLSLSDNCADVLIQRGSKLFLYNTKRAEVPGVNPIQFANLEEYIEFTEWQRSQGILCPILYLQHSFDAQGDSVYKARPSPTNLQGGLTDYVLGSNVMPLPTNVPIAGSDAKLAPGGGISPSNAGADSLQFEFDATRNDIPYNKNSYPGFDAHHKHAPLITPLDKMFYSNTKVSPNPMDDNWGGAKYTDSLIDAGYYKDNEVNKSGH